MLPLLIMRDPDEWIWGWLQYQGNDCYNGPDDTEDDDVDLFVSSVY